MLVWSSQTVKWIGNWLDIDDYPIAGHKSIADID